MPLRDERIADGLIADGLVAGAGRRAERGAQAAGIQAAGIQAAGVAGPVPARRTLALRLAQRHRLRALRAERLSRIRAGLAPATIGEPVAGAATGAAPWAAAPAAAQVGAPAPASARISGIRAARSVAQEEDAAAALAEFLRALTEAASGDGAGATGMAAAPTPALPTLAPPMLAPPMLAPVPPSAVLTFPRAPEAPVPRLAVSGRVATDLDRLPGAGPGLVWALERAGIRSLADVAALAPEALASQLGPLGRLVPAARWTAAARAASNTAANTATSPAANAAAGPAA